MSRQLVAVGHPPLDVVKEQHPTIVDQMEQVAENGGFSLEDGIFTLSLLWEGNDG